MPGPGYNAFRLRHDQKLSKDLSRLRADYFQLLSQFQLCKEPFKKSTTVALLDIIEKQSDPSTAT